MDGHLLSCVEKRTRDVRSLSTAVFTFNVLDTDTVIILEAFVFLEIRLFTVLFIDSGVHLHLPLTHLPPGQRLLPLSAPATCPRDTSSLLSPPPREAHISLN